MHKQWALLFWVWVGSGNEASVNQDLALQHYIESSKSLTVILCVQVVYISVQTHHHIVTLICFRIMGAVLRT